jgi:hypothetical protein
MGKNKTDETRVSFTAMLKPSQITEIKRFAKTVGTTPSIMAGNLIDMGLDDAMLLEKSGFLKIVLMGKDVFNKVKTKIMKGEQIEVKDMII